jgi:hypothetical protein
MDEIDDQLAVGQLRRQQRLDSEAIYRVTDLTPSFAHVEVVEAPGLQAGQRFKFTRDAVRAMTVMPAAAPATAAPARSR